MAKSRSPEKENERLLAHIKALESERDRLKKRDRSYQAYFDRISDELVSEHPRRPDRPDRFEGLSLVVVYYDIPQQIERSLLSYSPEYQGVAPDELEVILVDNGSTMPLPDDLQTRFPHVSQIIRLEGKPSPVFALNEGARAARFDMVAFMIDGAHMLSPGVVRNAREIWGMFEQPVISVPQYILGAESQNLVTRDNAFDVESEDLANLGWPADGYRLFDYAVFPGEYYHRTYTEAIETNCLITTRAVLDKYGAFDQRYDEPGGGFANLEIFSRLTHAPDNTFVVLPGEGSFHQDHGGTTTQKSPDDRALLVAAYRARHKEVTGSTEVLNTRSPFLYGRTRRLTQRIPTISKEFGKECNRILKQLSNIYVGRLLAGLKDDFRLELTSGGVPDERHARVPLPALGLGKEAACRNGVDEKALSYLTCLKEVHKAVQPNLYFEIGIDTGNSLSLAQCPSVGVDPAFMLSSALPQPTRIFRQTSDDFFANTKRCQDTLGDGIDLAFIDGMHLAEFVLRDFIETEKWMRPGGVILFDDVLPEQMEMLERERRFAAWTGDVYKIVPILRKYRPDLRVSVFETFIGPYRKGLAMITGADPSNRVLETKYAQIEAELAGGAFDVGSIRDLDQLMRPAPITDLRRAATGARLGDLAACAHPNDTHKGPSVPKSPSVSLVVVSYDMARELPRTIETLAPSFQTGLTAQDYEIIIVDNGSATPPDHKSLFQLAPNARIITLPGGQISPCHAANVGLAAARGDVIGMFIDGARMASPGLVSRAVAALGQDGFAVAGTFGLHLGPDVQSVSTQNGYDQTAEDVLLAGTDWRSDGYQLFDISVLAKSSGKGWDVLPSESNGFFLHRDFWEQLNGYDERFTSAGGGLCNLDIWKRICEWPDVHLRMIQGEGTFHQFHGGTTTGPSGAQRQDYDTEYAGLRGEPYARPKVNAEFIAPETPQP